MFVYEVAVVLKRTVTQHSIYYIIQAYVMQCVNAVIYISDKANKVRVEPGCNMIGNSSQPRVETSA